MNSSEKRRSLISRIKDRVQEMILAREQLVARRAEELIREREQQRLPVISLGGMSSNLADRILMGFTYNEDYCSIREDFNYEEYARIVVIKELNHAISLFEKRINRDLRHLERLKTQIRQLVRLNLRSLIRNLRHFLFKNMDDTHRVFGQLTSVSSPNFIPLIPQHYGAGYSIHHQKTRIS